MTKRIKIAGIDENGLGPRLGPLVVTGALFECADGYEPAAFFEALASGAGGAGRVGDSKAVMGFRNMARGEEIVLAFAMMIALNRGVQAPKTVFDLLRLFCGIDPDGTSRDCPPGAARLCFEEDEAVPLFGGEPARAQALASSMETALASSGIRIKAARSNPLCPSRFNAAFTRMEKPSKALLDLALFEDSIRALAPGMSGEGLYLCGKVMGLSRYSAHMSLIREYPLEKLQESRAESSYELQGLGEVRFVLDGDAAHGPVAVASMIGKYVRELFVRNLNRFFAGRVERHEDASGYCDKATAELIRKAMPVLKAEGIPAACFLRER